MSTDATLDFRITRTEPSQNPNQSQSDRPALQLPWLDLPSIFDDSNPNPPTCPPPSTPLPACPTTPSFDFPDFGLLNLSTATQRGSSSRRSTAIGKSPLAATFATGSPRPSISERTLSEAFFLDAYSPLSASTPSRPTSRPSSSTNSRPSSSKPSKRSSPTTSAMKMSRATSPTSPRFSVASDIMSLSETSKSLHNLSKRYSILGEQEAIANASAHSDKPTVKSSKYASSSYSDRNSEMDFDPFEFDRFTFDDPKSSATNSASSLLSSAGGSSSTSDSSSGITTNGNQLSSVASFDNSPNGNEPTRATSKAPILEPSSPRTVGMTGKPSFSPTAGEFQTQTSPVSPKTTTIPTLNSPTGSTIYIPASRPTRTARINQHRTASQDLIQKSLDLADRRAVLDQRRATLLGVPKKDKKPVMGGIRMDVPPPIDGKKRPAMLDLHSTYRIEESAEGERSSTADSVSSSSTARPRPSPTTNSLMPRSPAFFSPSSMTFGGDCHPMTASSDFAPPIPPKDFTALSSTPTQSSIRASLSKGKGKQNEKVAEEDERAFSPDMNVLLQSTSQSLARSNRSPTGATSSSTTPTSATTPNRTSVSARIRRVAPAVATRRLSTVSSSNSLRAKVNYSYPFDAFVEEGTTEPEDAVEGEKGSEEDDGFVEEETYYSHLTGLGSSKRISSEDNGNDSDSSLDLHTPLPDILVRAGVLSSKSALYATSPSSSSEVSPKKLKEQKAADLAKGIGSKVISRNRLVRHRDGKNLGLGLGLTTGLGWSDSEDEDAPSPLRRQISYMVLNKNNSMASLGAATPARAPIPRSVSGPRASTSSTSVVKPSNLSKLKTTNLKGSQSMAQINANVVPKATPVPSRLSMCHVQGPPSSFASPRSSKQSSSSQSSLGSILMNTLPPTRSPASSSTTSLSTASTSTSPLTPMDLSSPALGMVSEEAESTPRKMPSKSDLKGYGFSRSRSSSQVMPPPSSFAKPQPVIPTPNRARTSSSGSVASSSIPGPRQRTTSTSSATSSASGVKSKSSLASLRSAAMAYPPPPPPVRVMTVGSLAFPTPPPLSPAMVNLRMAHASEMMRSQPNSFQPVALRSYTSSQPI